MSARLLPILLQISLGGPDAPLDLRWLLFGLLTLVILSALGAIWLDRRLRRAPMAADLPEPEDWPALLDRLPFGILLLEAGGGPVQLANRPARDWLGMDGAGAEGWTLAEPESDPAPADPEGAWRSQIRSDAAAARASMGARASMTAQSGEGLLRDLDLPSGRSLRAWTGPLGGLDLVCLSDETARRRAEQSGRHLLGELAHELRTPLATLLTHLELLAAEDLPAEARRQSRELARDEAARMRRLIRDMLDLGRLEAGARLDLRPLSPLGLAESVLAQMRERAEGSGARLALSADAGLPSLSGDEDLLHRLLVNLVDNALAHGGTGVAIELSLAREAGGLRIALTDDGPGVPAEHLGLVTQRFYRADPRPTGSGLGLAMAAEILRLHGSRLELESPPAGRVHGLRASFHLPGLRA